MNIKCCEYSSTFIFIDSFFIIECNKDSYKSLDRFEIQQDLTGPTELAALERLKKSP